MNLWDVDHWVGDLAREAVAAAVRRREAIQAAKSKVKALVGMRSMGSSLLSLAAAASAPTAPSSAGSKASVPMLGRGKPAASAGVGSDDDADSDDSDLSTPRILANLDNATRPVQLLGHKCVVGCVSVFLSFCHSAILPFCVCACVDV